VVLYVLGQTPSLKAQSFIFIYYRFPKDFWDFREHFELCVTLEANCILQGFVKAACLAYVYSEISSYAPSCPGIRWQDMRFLHLFVPLMAVDCGLIGQ